LPRVEVVLAHPESAANIGAAARVVRNTGLAGLRLVDPGDWRTVECWRTAWGAQEVLEQARVFSGLPEAIADAHLVVAFSGRRDPGVALVDVRDAAAEVASLAPDEAACLVFGPETHGLSLDELAVCGRRAVIPAHSSQPSLNLAQAVMVGAYEVFRATSRPAPLPRRATQAEKEAMLSLLRAGLLAAGALPGVNTDAFFEEWRALFVRADLMPKEVRLLEHLARKLARSGETRGEVGG
jgi:tRNA/rRNA methyltransferase